MDNDKLKAANALNARMEAHDRTVSELNRLASGGRIIAITRTSYNAPVVIETTMSKYEIHNVGEDVFADTLWDRISSEISAVAGKIAIDRKALGDEFEKM
jgi:hypothetical protein